MQGASGVVAMKRSIVFGKGLAKLKAGGGHRARQRAVGGSHGIHDEVDTVLHTLAGFLLEDDVRSLEISGGGGFGFLSIMHLVS